MKQNLEYFRIHTWMIYHHGKASKCENELCESVSPKRFEWALLKGMGYKRDRNNYIQLCPSCHRKYDYTEEQREKQKKAGRLKFFTDVHKKNISLSSKGKGVVSILQKNKNGVIICTYESVSNASKITGISQSAISNTLTKRSKTAGGFIWQYKQKN